MIYSRTTDEILRELNGLIVQARETAAYTEKKVKAADGAADVYALFWERIAARADALADELSQTLERITAIARQPDEITFRFQIIKAIEDAAFQAHITVFQTKLMLSRAKPEHRAAYGPLCERYSALAQSAGIRAGTIAGFFSELAELIFQDMRKNARQALDDAIDKGRRALGILWEDTALPYAYIAEEVGALTDEISALALEELTVGRLENDLLRLDMVLFAADMDVLRAPSHEPLFRGIADFREQLARAMEIFQKLAWDAPQAQTEEEESRETRRKKYSDLALQESILLFSLKGEIQKLDGCLTQEQKAAADVICDSMKRVIGLAEHAADREVAGEIAGVLGEACTRMDGWADSLGPYGEPLRFLAGEAAGPAKYL